MHSSNNNNDNFICTQQCYNTDKRKYINKNKEEERLPQITIDAKGKGSHT